MPLEEKEYALIVAGGKGTRFKSSIPKQFQELRGKPVLLHTVEAFYRYSETITVVVVLPEEDHGTWRHITEKYDFKEPVIVKTGGLTRFQSVRKGLEGVGDGWVAIHDGVRPMVSTEIIANSFRLARTHQCAVASVDLRESLRSVQPGSPTPILSGTRSVDRSRYRIVQTPQTFQTTLIKKAYAAQEDPSLTDDASVAEKSGFAVCLFDGSYQNIKITTPEDLAIAEALMASRSSL